MNKNLHRIGKAGVMLLCVGLALVTQDIAARTPNPTPNGSDSVVRRTAETGSSRFTTKDMTFRTPCDLYYDGEVAPRFAAAERWQRSKFALKINLLYGAAAQAPNLRAEFGLGYRTTLEVGGSYNGWEPKDTAENPKKLIHGIGIGEFRYWLCERFSGHYFGLHAFGGFYDIVGRELPLIFEKEFRYDGTVFGAGISYGYMLPLSPRWSIEFNLGAGVAQFKYDRYAGANSEESEGKYKKNYFGPTRAGIDLVFIIK